LVYIVQIHYNAQCKKRKIIIMYYIENAVVVPKLKIRPKNHANRSVKLCKRFVFIQFKFDPLFSKSKQPAFN